MKSETRRERLVGNLAIYGMAVFFLSFIAIMLFMLIPGVWVHQITGPNQGHSDWATYEMARSISRVLFGVAAFGAGMVFMAIMISEGLEQPRQHLVASGLLTNEARK